MPTIVTNYPYGKLDGTYILPPIQYPDGKYYLKLGHHDMFEGIVTTSEAMKNWYEDGKGNTEAVNELSAFITDQFIPSIHVVSVHGGCCVTAKVIKNFFIFWLPYLGKVTIFTLRKLNDFFGRFEF